MARRVSRFVGRQRRQADWSSVLVRTRVTGLASTQSLGAVSVGSEALERFTTVRLRGNAYVHLDPGAVGDSMVVGLGLVIVSADAFAAGAASMPSPIDDLDWAFLWHQLFILGPSIGSTEGDQSLDQIMRVVIDAKAQRKNTPGEVLAFIWDAVIDSGAPTADGYAAVRELGLRT